MIKRHFCGILLFCLGLFIFAESIESTELTESIELTESTELTESAESTLPQAKRPLKPTNEQLITFAEKDESHNSDEYTQKCIQSFKYGLETEIIDLIDELTKNDDMRFVDEIYDLFLQTKDPDIKQKIILYFTKLKDPCLENFAVAVINDPYEERKETVKNYFLYVAAVDCKEAIPGAISLIDKEDEDFFDNALTCIGEIGGAEEAEFLAAYLDRDDLTVPQKQSLMKVLGRIKAIETWDKLSEIAQDSDENSFVRMYAAEAIGAMQKSESEPILLRLFEEDDPNFRVYVVKGISHFSDENSDNLIIQALRDDNYKVRYEAVKISKEKKLTQAVPFLIYRCKDKTEQTNVKDECYKTIAFLNTEEGNNYLISLVTDKKIADNIKIKAIASLLENNNTGTKEILTLAEEVLTNDIRKSLRYAIGKEFAKYGRPEFEDICSQYLASKDVSTQGTGLDIFARGKYQNLVVTVETIASDDEDKAKEINDEKEKNKTLQFSVKKANANAKKAKRILDQIKGQ